VGWDGGETKYYSIKNITKATRINMARSLINYFATQYRIFVTENSTKTKNKNLA
jgi:hypothetical protein